MTTLNITATGSPPFQMSMFLTTVGSVMVVLGSIGFAILMSPMKLQVENSCQAAMGSLLVWGYPTSLMMCGLQFLGVEPFKSSVYPGGLMMMGCGWTWLRYAFSS